MPAKADTHEDTMALQVKVGKEFFSNVFRRGDFLEALKQLIHNSREPHALAQRIWLQTEPPRYFQIRDDGNGIAPHVRREGYVGFSVDNVKRAKGEYGQKGTGGKFMFYGFSVRVKVATATKESPDEVILFEMDVATHQAIAFGQAHDRIIQERIVWKTKANWPYDQDRKSVV